MTYEEFKQIVDDIGGYSVSEDEYAVFVKSNDFLKWNIRIPKTIERNLFFKEFIYGNNDIDLVRAVLELAKTPLEKREPEKKYCLRHKFMGATGENYLNSFNGNEFDISNNEDYGSIQARFTQKEIEDLKKKFNVTLEDFELVEVEE